MSFILYYSFFCYHCKKILETITKTSLIDDNYFICIDKRIKEKDNKIYIILENGQKLIMPENVDKVPALLLLNNFNVLYGEDIYNFVKPKQTQMVKQATMNNMEPLAYCLGGGSCGIVSDNFSFLDMDADSLQAKGDGGLRQLHNYVSLSNEEQVNIYTPSEDNKTSKSQKIQEGLTIEQLQQQRDQDMAIMKNKPRQYI